MIYIIAFGNPMRGDDGFAWKAAEMLEPVEPEVTLLTLYQLSPELSEDISQSDAVIFLDARRGQTPGEMFCETIEGRNIPSTFTHTLTPAMLLAYSQGLYGRAPRATMISVTGKDFNFSTELSAPVAAAVSKAVDKVKSLIKEYQKAR